MNIHPNGPAKLSPQTSQHKEAAAPNRWALPVMSLVLALTLPSILGFMILSLPADKPHPMAAVAAKYGVSPIAVASGEATYSGSCALCHGKNGEGIPRLGKPLRNSQFVQSLTDGELFEFLNEGRMPDDPANTTGVMMPARGGDPFLYEQKIESLVAFLRTMQDPAAPFPDLSSWSKPVVSLTPGSGGTQIGGLDAAGHQAFLTACSACHGPNGEGLAGLGKPLADSPFVSSKSNAELIKFVKQGRPIWDPENTTGVDMPPKGGNPALSDEQLTQIVSYIRTLHGAESGQ